jgi:hypothetical protein
MWKRAQHGYNHHFHEKYLRHRLVNAGKFKEVGNNGEY